MSCPSWQKRVDAGADKTLQDNFFEQALIGSPDNYGDALASNLPEAVAHLVCALTLI